MSRKNERLADLVRMLNLLPYFEAHPERTVMEAARDLGRAPDHIMDDLNRLWCCGLPGLMPGDLVEMEHDYRKVRVDNAQGMDRPLRLTTTEAAALLLALENLEATPGLVDKAAVTSAATKLRGIMGSEVAAVVDATADAPEDPILTTVRIAMDEGQQLTFAYFSQTTFDTSTRVVSPAHIFTRDGFTYLTGWDHGIDAHRTFRTDRMSDVTLTDEASQPHLAKLSLSATDPFGFARTRKMATVRVAPHYAWIADYVPLTLGEADTTGWISGTIPIGSEEWLVRFVLACEGNLTIVAPQELADIVTERAQAGLRAYDELLSHSDRYKG
ncbi:WYL domain-containing protein [Corynebacterium hindlerae]|uniref:WYL domain-containing protein n=1 Tax=Corynebacterium hindlerae TaxID=699041 RepID=A0A7G5FFA2_9CORY|nr:WYL domain-containing protein [Corynebacterium hindlerae]QMV85293.1 WYL domain-containing protein [Corynebacterium hindlerae]